MVKQGIPIRCSLFHGFQINVSRFTNWKHSTILTRNAMINFTIIPKNYQRTNKFKIYKSMLQALYQNQESNIKYN